MAASMNAAHTEILDPTWLERYGARMARALLDYGRRNWRYIRLNSPFTYVGWEFGWKPWISTGTPLPDEINLSHCYHFFNKTATIYLFDGCCYEIGRDASRRTWPNGSDIWVPAAYKAWTQECTMAEQCDSRFVLAPLNLSTEYDADLREAVGLGKVPNGQLLDLIPRLIDFHLGHCDLIHNQAIKAAKAADELKIKNVAAQERNMRSDFAHYSSLTPTSRAVFLIGRGPMPEPMNVLLILTGQHQDMESGPPTFDIIPSDEIVNTRADNIIEVSLKTAIRYLRTLERREEVVNEAFRSEQST